ncbi:MAG TPA: hypothetical protein EYN06_06840 [Myxococcales bacterium]|nr:hypothetical protein [Myxococcales bacterium]HIN86180.1 hypothetical protein [Myxococcales bacterium]
MSDRITREVTPFVEVLEATRGARCRLVRQYDNCAAFEEDGRMVLHVPGTAGRIKRLLLDPDSDLYQFVCGAEPEHLKSSFEIHLDKLPKGELPRILHGHTLVISHQGVLAPECEDAEIAVRSSLDQSRVPTNAAEVHLDLTHLKEMPSRWPSPSPPMLGEISLGRAESTEILPELMHAMGSGRCPLRELRLRVEPSLFQAKNRRSPFLSEVVELISSASGVSPVSLSRDLALRHRLLSHGMRRHLVPEPYFVTWLFRGHNSRGLISVTDQFPIPRRPSRKEILRGTPESEHDRLLKFLSLLDDTSPRLSAFAERGFFAVSVHFLPNKGLAIRPNHGGITYWDGQNLVPLQD